MHRIHFIELEDQRWMPHTIRNGITTFLQFAVDRSDIYKKFAERLSKVFQHNQTKLVIDLCSGGGGPMKSLLEHVPELRQGKIKVHLTDFYPNLPAFMQLATEYPKCFSYSTESISALNVSPALLGFRTLFSSFHHFDKDAARQILKDAVIKNQGIAIAESTQRHILLLAYMLLTPFLVVLTSPFQKPFRWSRIFWTYVIPVIPLAVCFDGIVSCLRTYTPEELMEMVNSIPEAEHYVWQAGIEKIGLLPVGVTYLIGYPKAGLN